MPTKVNNLVALLDGYFTATGQHINVNVLEPGHPAGRHGTP